MNRSLIMLRRLRVLRGNHIACDEQFHEGVNIISGENGSGKSSIADFIFFVLGGDFDDWKEIPALCTEVQVETETSSGVITISRETHSRQSSARVFIGPLEDAINSPLESWSKHPMKRSERQESFSQLMFGLIGIPQAQSVGASNITMHQIMRLLYSDQQTPARELFRQESFDSPDIRAAVGELLCGVGIYETYETQLKLRELRDEFDNIAKDLVRLYATLPEDHSLQTTATIESSLSELGELEAHLIQEIEDVDNQVRDASVSQFVSERKKAANSLAKVRRDITQTEDRNRKIELEVDELVHFISYLTSTKSKLETTERSTKYIGTLEFSYCPNCLLPLDVDTHPKDSCYLCGRVQDADANASKYLHVKLDLENQITESSQLLHEKHGTLAHLKNDLRILQSDHRSKMAEYATTFDVGSGPRELYLAERYRKLGSIQKEVEFLQRLQTTAEKIAEMIQRKSDLQLEISKLEDRKYALEKAGTARFSQAVTSISQICCEILPQDLPRQEAFFSPDVVTLNFRQNSIHVDGQRNFAESSNVILKNAAILAIWIAACRDNNFWHPRFCLFDNIEDKGMEDPRSHNFQDLVIEYSKTVPEPHQIIFTTSTISPTLEGSDFVVGPKHTRSNPTLKIRPPSL